MALAGPILKAGERPGVASYLARKRNFATLGGGSVSHETTPAETKLKWNTDSIRIVCAKVFPWDLMNAAHPKFILCAAQKRHMK